MKPAYECVEVIRLMCLRKNFAAIKARGMAVDACPKKRLASNTDLRFDQPDDAADAVSDYSICNKAWRSKIVLRMTSLTISGRHRVRISSG